MEQSKQQQQVKRDVIKHSAAIQIQNNVTLLQRRAWNVLLANAYDELPIQDIPTTSFDMPLCMPSCIRHDCLSICLICNVPSCCESHLMDLIERWQPHRSIGAM